MLGYGIKDMEIEYVKIKQKWKNVKKYSIVLFVVAAIYGLFAIIKGAIYISDGRGGIFRVIAGLLFIGIAIKGIINYRKMKDLDDEDGDKGDNGQQDY